MHRTARYGPVFTLLAALTLFAQDAHAITLTGHADVIDGDTMVLDGQRIRLQDIDALESDQMCSRPNGQYRCGRAATEHLRGLMAGSVRCVGSERGKYGRLLATCFAKGKNVNKAMVLAGWAVAFRKYSDRYVAEERVAREGMRGIWAGSFMSPGDYRHRGDVGVGVDGCSIKGNLSSHGERIYHVPGGEHYGRTKINIRKGERWFCLETEAVDAGWRRAK